MGVCLIAFGGIHEVDAEFEGSSERACAVIRGQVRLKMPQHKRSEAEFRNLYIGTAEFDAIQKESSLVV